MMLKGNELQACYCSVLTLSVNLRVLKRQTFHVSAHRLSHMTDHCHGKGKYLVYTINQPRTLHSETLQFIVTTITPLETKCKYVSSENHTV